MMHSSLVSLVGAGANRASLDKPAVMGLDKSLSYRDLLAGGRGIAAALREAGIGRGDRVGLWMDKTPACVQAILGVLMAGAAYVPLDPRAPWRRCRAIALNCGFAGLVVDSPRLPALADFLEGQRPRLIIIDDEDPDRAAAALASAAKVLHQTLGQVVTWTPAKLPDLVPDDIAYILYTSGSTGTPKGVVHTHGSGLGFACWIQERFGVVPDDIFSSHAPFHFDLSISDLFSSLGSGAGVRLISTTEAMLAPYLVRNISHWGITVWYSVPSILVAMLDKGELEQRGLPTLRLLFFAGEVFPTPQLRRLRRALPHVGLYNLFGPTETNVCTYYQVPADIPDHYTVPIPIGKACEHLETFILDDEGREVGVGVEGTLWAKGENLMHSYWSDPERTAATLRPDSRGRQGLAYCTGDRVRLQPDGNYEFLGRRDHLIKTRGYRVELGDIEGALASHQEVLEAVATALPDPELGSRIVASVVPRSSRALDGAVLRAFCRQHLPMYMIPEQIEVRPELPRTSTGKADRATIREQWELRRRHEH
jgi:amino acid adenylation domain-containing protein